MLFSGAGYFFDVKKLSIWIINNNHKNLARASQMPRLIIRMNIVFNLNQPECKFWQQMLFA